MVRYRIDDDSLLEQLVGLCTKYVMSIYALRSYED